MTHRCGRCEARRGRRSCPALGAICSRCCGGHRGLEIACPEECAYLGERAGGPLERATRHLLTFLQGSSMDDWRQVARAAFFGGEEPAAADVAAERAYLAFGHVDEAGKRGVDLLLEQPGADLDPKVRDALASLSEAWLSLFEVLEVHEHGLRFLDRVRSTELFVHDRYLPREAKPGHLYLFWVMRYRGHCALAGGLYLVAHQLKARALQAIEQALEEAPASQRADRRQSLCGAALAGVYISLREAASAWEPPQSTAPGEDAPALCRAIYELRDVQEVEERLLRHPEFVSVGAGRFEWRDGAQGDDVERPRSLATVKLKTVRLTLSATSKARLREASAALEKALRGAIQHRYDREEEGVAPQLTLDPKLGSGDPGEQIDAFQQVLAEHILAELDEGEIRGARGEASAPRRSERGRGKAQRLAALAHEVMCVLVPDLRRTVADVARRARAEPRWDEAGTLSVDALQDLDQVKSFIRDHLVRRMQEGVPHDEGMKQAPMLLSHLHYAVNHELHRRKTFWVDESLAWMLKATELDIQGACLRLPFPSCAFAFTDRSTLELGESLLREEGALPPGSRFHILTVYLSACAPPAGEEEATRISLYMVFDPGTGEWPYLLNRDLLVHPRDNLQAILESSADEDPGARVMPHLLRAPEMRKLVHLTLNAVLYATSANLDPILLPPDPGRRKGKRKGKGRGRGGRRRPTQTSKQVRLGRARSGEEVFYLPGKIPIARVRQLQQLEDEDSKSGGQIMKRFMVRGHWRRANPSWKDQRLRWVEPYWKGPDVAMIIEREYRLRP